MTLENQAQVDHTLTKLARLEARYDALKADTLTNPRIRELSMSSLRRLINQFKEEIARFEAHHTARA